MYQIDPIKLCEFYHGEKTNPFDEILYAREAEITYEERDALNAKAMFWFYEFCWVRVSHREELLSWYKDAIGAGLHPDSGRRRAIVFQKHGLNRNLSKHKTYISAIVRWRIPEKS